MKHSKSLVQGKSCRYRPAATIFLLRNVAHVDRSCRPFHTCYQQVHALSAAQQRAIWRRTEDQLGGARDDLCTHRLHKMLPGLIPEARQARRAAQSTGTQRMLATEHESPVMEGCNVCQLNNDPNLHYQHCHCIWLLLYTFQSVFKLCPGFMMAL